MEARNYFCNVNIRKLRTAVLKGSFLGAEIHMCQGKLVAHLHLFITFLYSNETIAAEIKLKSSPPNQDKSNQRDYTAGNSLSFPQSTDFSTHSDSAPQRTFSPCSLSPTVTFSFQTIRGTFSKAVSENRGGRLTFFC